MKKLLQRLTRSLAPTTRVLAMLVAVCATGGAWADFAKTNPVTGEAENYTWKFVGTDAWNGTGNWQDSSGANPSGTPAKSGENTWDPILFDNNDPGNTININAGMSVEGWNLRMGLYNGASVTMNNFVKYQGDTTMWMTVDETSQLTIGGFGGGNITDGQAIKLSVAKANGITWTANLTSGNANNTFEYYLKGAGSVSYQAVSAANHKIKMADVSLSGTSQVASKTLVSFTSTTKTFTADASIKVKDSEGNLVCTKALSSVTSGSTTLTGSEKVGTCELVQTSTGIVLYYVDGDPAEAAYTPSININFTHNGNGINTEADLGLAGYAVPGSAWNNIAGVVGTTSSTIKKIDSTGTATVDAGVSVEVSDTRGSWQCNQLSAATELRQGYIDESSANATPTVTITGVPYTNYRVIIYHSTDSPNYPFGYDTINGVNFTYVNGEQAIGTSSWGDAGASNNANPIEEGVNTLVSGILSGSTVTFVAHRIGGDSPSARGCFAAIQVVQVDVGEGNLLIPVSGDTTYTVSEDSSYTKVIVSGTGTLTLEGTGTITAGTLEIEHNSAVIMNEDCIASTTVIGGGTAIYDGAAPTAGKGWKDGSNWTGTVQVRNVTNLIGASGSGTYIDFNEYGNANSVFELNGVTGWINPGYICNVPLKITNTLYLNNGYSNKANAFKVGTLLGAGTISGDGSAPTVVFNVTTDWSGFTGTIGLNNKCVVFGETIPDSLTAGTIYVSSGAVVTPQQSSGVWWAVGGIKVDGELRAPNLSKFGGGTGITTGDNGVFTLTSTANVNDANYSSGATSADLSRITGTGTLKYSSTAGWRAFPTAADHMPASTLTLQMELADSLIISQNNGETVVGSLAGSKNIRSDFGSNGGNGRILTVTQSKDTEWEGTFVANRITKFNVVAPAEGTPGTLTLSGTQSLSGSTVTTIPMQVDGSVNLTGTWVGNTTVSGTIGGTGTLTGSLTFSDGATFNVSATDENGLSVSGTVTFPGEGESATVVLSGVTPSASGTKLISSDSSIGSIANVSCATAILKVENNALVAYPAAASIDDGTLYDTLAEALEVDNAIITMLKDYDGTATMKPGQYLVQNGFNVTEVVGQAAGVVVTRHGNSLANYYWTCVDERTATWSGAASVYWAVAANWTEGFAPSETYTEVTIPSTESHSTAITLAASVSIKSLTLGAGETLTLSTTSENTPTLTTTTAIELTSGQSIVTGSGVTLAPAPVSGEALSYVTTTTAGGTTTYALQSAGAMDGEGKATITDATEVVTVPATATSVVVVPGVTTFNLAAGSTITESNVSVVYNGTTDITGAFTCTIDGNTVTLTLDASGSVDGVSVTPAVDTSVAEPMAVDAGAPQFTVKTIPGLWYAVEESTSPTTGFGVVNATKTQATTTSTTLPVATAPESGVKYYKIAVGATSAM